MRALTEALAESVKLPDTKGALVADVTSDSPAARAGIRIGDVMVVYGPVCRKLMTDPNDR